ncbi:MAG: GT4 family glycosyltransferase PelF [Candidatus Tectomicrobia bacterium]|nr:GT4 family glycosyltransferase PelF [Candidatus Tectomicrobia bacterium]
MPRSIFSRKIKLLHIITNLDYGGAPLALFGLLDRLDHHRYEMALATGLAPDSQRDLIDEARKRGYQVIPIPSLVRQIDPVKDFLALCHLWRLIRSGGYDIIHTHKSKGGFLGRLAAKLAGAPVIIHSPHGHVFEGYFGPAVSRLFLELERVAGRFSDKIVALTESERNEYKAWRIGDERRVTVIPNGIDIATYKRQGGNSQDKRAELGFSGREWIIATVGRLVPIKGHTYLIAALKRVIEKVPEARLWLIGDGPLRKALEEEVEALGMARYVSFLGLRDDVPELLSAIDLFVLPSLNEGFGLVLIEAMVMEKPVVAFEVGGVPDIVIHGEVGLLVPARDVEALATAIISLEQDRALAKKMGQKGAMRVKAYFGIEVMVEKFESLYEGLLSSKVIGE